MEPNVSNVLSVYRRVDNDAYTAGLSWYDDAHNFARALDPMRFHRAAGIIAALSPMNHWDNNKAKAAMFYALDGKPVWNGKANGIGLAVNVRKAIRIYNGEDALDVLGGDKVRAFYSTIVEPHGDVVPVIDRHAFDIAVGMVTNDDARQALSRKGVYASFANVYREAAMIIGIGSAQLQAITWMQWRKEKGIG
jgi:hypothetical protein